MSVTIARRPSITERLSTIRLLGIGAVVVLVVVYFTDKQAATALLFGVPAGALVVAIALGVVLTYKGSGVVNFSSGAMATFSAYVFFDLRARGQLFIPPLPNPLAPVEGIVHASGNKSFSVPHWPTQVSFGDALGFWPSLLIALVVSALLGLVFHFLVFRPLREAPALAKVVASVGLLTVLQAVVIRRFGVAPLSLRPVFSKKPVKLPRGILMPRDEIIVTAIVIVAAIALWALYRFTRFGVAARAASENEKGAILLGYSPDALAAAGWVLSAVVIGLFGILVATMNTSVDPNTMVLLIVPALAAALVGGFTSFGVTVVAGIGIAMGQSLLQDWSTRTWFPHSGGTAIPGLAQVLPVVVIIAVLVFKGNAIPDRAALRAPRMPWAPLPGSARAISIRGVVLGVVVIGALLLVSPPWRLGITTSLIGVAVCLSLVVVTGLVGQISLAQLTLAGVAGFLLSKLVVSYGVPFPLAPIIAILGATIFGALVAVPALRVRGVNLAIVTLAIAVAIENTVFTNPQLAGSTFGATVPPPRFFDLRFGPGDATSLHLLGFHGDGKQPSPWFGIFCLFVVLAAALLTLNLRRSGTGRVFLAVRSNERASAAAGVSLTRTKVVAFSAGAFIAGIGGVLTGYSSGTVTANTFGSFPSITLLVFAYLGGISSVGGAFAGGLLISGGVAATALAIWFHVGSEFVLLLGGIGVVLTVVMNPEGIAGATRIGLRDLRAKLPQARGTPIVAEESGVPAA